MLRRHPPRRHFRAPCLVALALGSLGTLDARAQTDLLPDIIIQQSYLYDNDTVSYIVPGRRHLRLSNATPNIGAGKLYAWGGEDLGNGTQRVYQRIFRDDGAFWDHEAGAFVYHPNHHHIHVEGWSVYRLREILPGDGVGPIVVEGEKTSFCLMDLGVYDATLPGFDPTGEFFACATTVQGISVGWYDLYSKDLPSQWIDITDVPPGEYWLEAEADPDNHFIESDETNNAARVKVTIRSTDPGGVYPDLYEPNNAFADVAARPAGAPASPNLGPVGPETRIEDLTITPSDIDVFRFYMPAPGGPDDFIRIEFEHDEGDLTLRLLSATGTLLGSANTAGDVETLSLSGRPAGWYNALVTAAPGDFSPGYALTLNPSANGAPSVTLLDPPPGDTKLQHGADSYPVRWTSSDPEDNERWVTLLVNHEPALDGHELVLPNTISTPAADGRTVINSAYLEPGTYWVYARITDGGTITGSWSQGTVTFVRPCPADLTGDGLADVLDLLAFFDAYSTCEGSTEPCEHEGANPDFNDDGTVDALDAADFLDAFSQTCE